MVVFGFVNYFGLFIVCTILRAKVQKFSDLCKRRSGYLLINLFLQSIYAVFEVWVLVAEDIGDPEATYVVAEGFSGDET